MADIFEVVFHGRGGQGAKTAAQLLVEAVAEQGKYIQAFPEFGPERRGAPVKAFARVSDSYILTHQPVTEPDVSVLLDESLIESVDVAKGLGDGILIVNSDKTPSELRLNQRLSSFKGKIYSVNASRIAIELIGKDITNTPMLGALVKATQIMPIDVLISKVVAMFEKKIGEKATQANVDMIKTAYTQCVS